MLPWRCIGASFIALGGVALFLFVIPWVKRPKPTTKPWLPWVGADGRWSTSKFQFFIWTAIVIYSYLTVWIYRALSHHTEALSAVPRHLLVAMGFTATTMAAAKGITSSYVASGRVDKSPDTPADPDQNGGGLFSDDDGVPDLSKIQVVAWTFIAAIVYLIGLYTQSTASELPELQDIDPSLMVLMGLGQAAYLGKKLVTSDTPRLTSINPAAIKPGGQVTLSGAAFGVQTESQLTFDGAVATVVYQTWTDSQVVFTFPQKQPNGKSWSDGQQVQVGVIAAGVSSANTLQLTVVKPRLDALSPSAANPGDRVTITGEFLGTAGQVTFDRTALASTVSWNDTAVAFDIPAMHPNNSAFTRPAKVAIAIVGDGVASANALELTIL